jgi:hypothetical protein
MYVVSIGTTLVVKRVDFDSINQSLTLISANPACPPPIISPDGSFNYSPGITGAKGDGNCYDDYWNIGIQDRDGKAECHCFYPTYINRPATTRLPCAKN